MKDDRRRLQLPAILVAGAAISMAGGLVSPVLPEVKEQLAIPPEVVGTVVSAHALTIALFVPLFGILADRLGPVRILLPAIALFSLSGSAGSLAGNFEFLLATRVLVGIGCAGISAATLGLVGQLYEGPARTQIIGYATATLTSTGIVFPLLGGLTGLVSWRLTFGLYLLLLPAIALAAAAFHGYKPDRATHAEEEFDLGLTKVLGHLPVIRALVGLSLTSAIMTSVVIYTPLYLQEAFDVDTLFNGLVLMLRALGAAIVSALATKPLAIRIGKPFSMALGYALMAIALISLPWLPQVPLIMLAAIVFGGGFGLTLPNLYGILADLSPKKLRSTMLGIGSGTGFLGQFLSPVVLGPVLDWGGHESVFYTAAGAAVFAAILAIVPLGDG